MKMLTAVAALLLAGTAHAGITNYHTTLEPEGGGGVAAGCQRKAAALTSLCNFGIIKLVT